MRSYRRQHIDRGGHNNGSFWLSFSDLMSSLLLIIILIMFYIMYQYFDMYEINRDEILRREYDLETATAELEEKSAKLTEAEQQMVAQQIRLDAAETELASAEEVLATQKEQLETAQSQLSEKETEIATQQAQLDALSAQLNTQQAELTAAQTELDSQRTQIETQQALLDSQQTQLEQLVGMRSQIIQAVSDALREADIPATVDPTDGSIVFESDVLFPTGDSTLSEAGKNYIERVLPVYLSVLLSDEYRPYVAEIIIEGHTDSSGGYMRNLLLSQERAYAVAEIVLERGFIYNKTDILRSLVTVNGRSSSDPILNEDGTENMDASRRVVFKFRLTDEQMIDQLKDILENGSTETVETTEVPETTETPETTEAPETTVEPEITAEATADTVG